MSFKIPSLHPKDNKEVLDKQHTMDYKMLHHNQDQYLIH
jgi:hypothetical protein